MTIHTTTNYGIAYVDTDTALVDLAAASQQAATTIDTALGRGGIAPPDATTQAQLAARTTAVENRTTALETRRLCKDVPLTGNLGVSGSGAALGTSPAVTVAAGHTVVIDVDCQAYIPGVSTTAYVWVRRLTAAGALSADLPGRTIRVTTAFDLYDLRLIVDDESPAAGSYKYQVLACVDMASGTAAVDAAAVKSAPKVRRMSVTDAGKTPAT